MSDEELNHTPNPVDATEPKEPTVQPEPTTEPEHQAKDTAASESIPADATPTADVRPTLQSRPRREKPQRRVGKKPVDRFVTVSFSAQREPVDDIFWCEAERDGAWIKILAVEQIRTRREVLERLTDLDSALVGLDFGFSYPAPLMEYLHEKASIADWPTLLKRVREALKKNVEDGLRVWIEHIGKYREAHLEPNPEPIRTWERGRYGARQQQERMPELYEQRSMAERFRRTEHAIRRAAEQALTSTLQVAYNKLTQRYEFGDTTLRGKKSLLGMSMLEQLIEAKPEVAIWPWKKPAELTIVEVFPWLFRREGTMNAKECRAWLEAEEDSGTDIPASAREMILRNPEAQRMFFTLMGIMRTEARVERTIRPLRDYPDQFYDDPKVKLEGWFYGVGYRLADPEGEKTSRTKPTRENNSKRGDQDRKKNDRPRAAKPTEHAATNEHETEVAPTEANSTADASEPVTTKADIVEPSPQQ